MDNRTWWRKAGEIDSVLFNIWFYSSWKVKRGGEYDNDEMDCVREQLWAIREGLA